MPATSAPPSAPPARLLSPAVWEPVAGTSVQLVVDSEQLHGRACVHCGSTLDGLMDAGHAYIEAQEENGRLGYPVKACPQHTPAVEGEVTAA